MFKSGRNSILQDCCDEIIQTMMRIHDILTYHFGLDAVVLMSGIA